MLTSEEFVTVELAVDGRLTTRTYKIVTGKDNILKTNMLERMMAGNIPRVYDERGAEVYDVHFVGMVWSPPYRLLQDVANDRMRLQAELAQLLTDVQWPVDLSKMTDEPPLSIPEKAQDTTITTLTQREMSRRNKLKKKIREAKRMAKHNRVPSPQAAPQATSEEPHDWMPRPYEETEPGGGWRMD